jgi:hypothetical protein
MRKLGVLENILWAGPVAGDSLAQWHGEQN